MDQLDYYVAGYRTYNQTSSSAPELETRQHYPRPTTLFHLLSATNAYSPVTVNSTPVNFDLYDGYYENFDGEYYTNYTISAGGTLNGSAQIDMTGLSNSFPEIPTIQNGTWSSGINFLSSSLLILNGFTSVGPNDSMIISISGPNPAQDRYLEYNSPITSLDMSSFGLVSGTTYEMSIDYQRFVSAATSKTGVFTSLDGGSTLVSRTNLQFSVIPEPSNYGILFACTTLLFCVRIRKRA